MKNWYEEALTLAYERPQYETAPRDMKIRETRNVHITIDPSYPLYEAKGRSTPLKYFAAEMIWYLQRTRTVEWISQYSKFWDSLKDDTGVINSNYGDLILARNEFGNSGWTWCYDSLVKDKDTRQAVLHFNNPSHRNPNTKDFPCTMYGIFSIRNGVLDLTIHMRSSDVIRGLSFDAPFFSVLLQSMWHNLRSKYEDLKLGKLEFFTNSLHSYERDWELIQGMISEKIELKPCIITHSLIDEFGTSSHILTSQYGKPIEDVQASLASWAEV